MALHEILPGIWTWPWFSQRHGYNFNGFLVADPDIGAVLRKLNLSHLAHVKAAIGKQSPSEPAMVSTNLAGTSVLTSVAPIESLNWYVFVEQPVSEVYAQLYASMVRTALLLLAVQPLLGGVALAEKETRRLREGPAQVRVADLLAAAAQFLAARLVSAAHQARVAEEIADLGKPADVVDLVE